MGTIALPSAADGRLTDAQQARRRQGLGASEVAAVVGLDKYRTAFDVWLAKRGLAIQGEETPAQRWGHILEAPVADHYLEGLQGGVPVWARQVGTLALASHPWALATPDRLIETAEGDAWLLEVKTRSPWQAAEWGEPGTDEVPDSVAVQCHWQMYVSGYDRCDVAVLLGGSDYRSYTLRAHAEIAADLFAASQRFWFEHVVPGVEPPITGAGAAEWIAQRYPKVRREELLAADPATADDVTRLVALKASIKSLESEAADLSTRIKAAIGDAKGLTTPAGDRAVWSEVKGRATVDWEAVARELGALPETIQRHTKLGAGYRQFRLTPAKGE